MKNDIRLVLRVAFMVLMSLMVLLPVTGCGQAVFVSQDPATLSLKRAWDTVADELDLQAQSAELKSFRLHIGKAGKVDSFSFEFSAYDTKGRAAHYQVSMDQKGLLHWESAPQAQQVALTIHPKRVFYEIDRVGLGTLTTGDEGLALQAELISGSVSYDYEHADIYHAENGNLRLLDKISFRSSQTWCPIHVFQLNSSSTGKTTTPPNSEPVPSGQRTSQIWFLNEAVQMATSVSYI
jgi:hypothetical protein